MLTIKNLRKRYGNFQALDGLNLEVADGELFGFVGPNGAGKTTTLKILAGLLVPDEGEVEIGGLDVYSDGKELRRRIGERWSWTEKICWPTPWACVCGSAMCRITLACMTI